MCEKTCLFIPIKGVHFVWKMDRLITDQNQFVNHFLLPLPSLNIPKCSAFVFLQETLVENIKLEKLYKCQWGDFNSVICSLHWLHCISGVYSWNPITH